MKKLGAHKKVKIAAGFGGESGPGSDQGLPQGSFLNVPVESLKPNPYQPRQIFNIEELEGLAESIKAHGVITPLCIFIEKGEYFIGGGERRWRASKIAGKPTVPCYVTTGNPAEIGLIENMFRQDLTPMEEAEAYARMQKEFRYTHQDLARVVGKSRNNITETLSLNKLPAQIREECLRVDISKRALIAIARMETPEAMGAAVSAIIGEKAAEPAKKKSPKKGWMSIRIIKIAEEIKRLDPINEALRLREIDIKESGGKAAYGHSKEHAAYIDAIERLQTAFKTTFPFPMGIGSKEEKRHGPEEGLHLSGTCRGKLLDAGFRLFRASELEKLIKELSPTGSWKLVSRHTTKKAMKEAMDEILKDPMSVRD